MPPLIVAFRQFLYLFHDVRRGVGSISFVLMGREEWPKHGRLALCHTQRSPTCWDPYLSLPVPGRNQSAQLSLHQPLDRLHCHSRIHVVVSSSLAAHLLLCSLSLLRPTMTTCTGHPNGECIAAVVGEHKLAQYSVVL